ncbi:MAG: phage integrase N-terminal SAM-like domain-containing protein [Candidatus Schekmanbacteria bacterium]|nr:phage integrase N-terminal SAM-like domain-containing protein [Candidatus Schekmanbacteria bacterium]
MSGPARGDAFHAEARLRHFSRRTEACNRGWVRRFHVANCWRHPAELGGAEAVEFRSDLATRGAVSASMQNQALAAILFLYRSLLEHHLPWLDEIVRAKRPHCVPEVLTRREVQELLGHKDAFTTMIYRCMLNRRPLGVRSPVDRLLG